MPPRAPIPGLTIYMVQHELQYDSIAETDSALRATVLDIAVPKGNFSNTSAQTNEGICRSNQVNVPNQSFTLLFQPMHATSK